MVAAAGPPTVTSSYPAALMVTPVTGSGGAASVGPDGPARRTARSVAALVLAGAATLAGLGLGAAARAGAPAPHKLRNPCLDREVRRERGLLCPDLRMRPPFDIEWDRTPAGIPVLRAANSIDSVGQGPAELRGTRSGRFSMDARHSVHKKGGGHATFETGARLAFKLIPDQGRYWKFRHAAHFELWLLDRDGNRKRRVETGPKQIYCLRDLEHTHPRLARSPAHRVYPSCSQDPNAERVKLGTSVGWSDVYPYTYHEQFVHLDEIPVRGCYAYVHIADPRNGILELDEENNEASTVVFLTERGRYLEDRCEDVRDRALAPSQTIDDSTQEEHEEDEEY